MHDCSCLFIFVLPDLIYMTTVIQSFFGCLNFVLKSIFAGPILILYNSNSKGHCTQASMPSLFLREGVEAEEMLTWR